MTAYGNRTRRTACSTLAVLIGLLSNHADVVAQRPAFNPGNFFAGRPVIIRQGSRPAGQTISLQEMLEKGLRARRPEEFAFLERVLDMVQKNQLSVKLVRSTFQWARSKRPAPFPYFERALKIRAARQGILVQ